MFSCNVRAPAGPEVGTGEFKSCVHEPTHNALLFKSRTPDRVMYGCTQYSGSFLLGEMGGVV